MTQKNESFTLEDLLLSIDKQASSAEGSDESAKDEGKESKTEEKNEKDKKAEGEGQEKSAADAGADLAKEVFEKVANIKTTIKGNEMNKQASTAGKALADAILTKLAGVGDLSTTDGVTDGTVPNKAIVDNAAMVSQDDAKIQPLPGTDGAGNGGTVNQIFESIVQDAMSEQTGEGQANEQGSMADSVKADESQEKMAAVMTLVENGMDFDSAVDLVKEAEQAIAVEEDAHVKQAAVGQLIAEGFDFETAVELVKEASEEGHGKAIARGARATGRGILENYAGAAGGGAAGAAIGALAAIAMKKAPSRGAGAGALPGALIGSVAGGLHGTGRSIQNQMREKKAAFEALVDAGVDFEKAAELVASKSQELYGV